MLGPNQPYQGQSSTHHGPNQHGPSGGGPQGYDQNPSGCPGANFYSNPVYQNQNNLFNYHLMHSYYEDPDAMQQLDRGIARLDDRITTAVGTQIYDHVEGSLKELLRLRTILSESRHYQNFTNDVVDGYVNEFLRVEDELTKQRRLSKKEEERLRGKYKVLTSLHKSPLPVI